MKCAAVLCLAAACFPWTGAARASEINSEQINWGYRFTNAVSHPWLGGPGTGFLFFPHNGGSGTMHSTPFVSTDIATKLWTISTASVGHPQSVEDKPFSVVLHLWDPQYHLPGAVTFTGTLSGDVWKSGSTLHPTFTSSLMQRLHLGGDIFTISFESFDPPSGNGSKNFGQFIFDVTVHHNPEPSTLILAGIGMPLLGFTLCRRRRS